MVDRTSIRILSLDGGSLSHAAVQLFVLSEIEQRLGTSIAGLFDVVAGVGSSAYLAAGLVIPDEGEELNSATELTTFYLRNIKQFVNPKRGLGSTGIEKPLQSFFKDSLLSEAKIELLLPMLDLQTGEVSEISSWNARDAENQSQDFLVSDLVKHSMSRIDAESIRPLTAKGGGKHLLASAASVQTNPAQMLHISVAALCNPNTEIQLVSLSSGVGNAGCSLADLRVMTHDKFACQTQFAASIAGAEQTHSILEANKTAVTYQRLAYQAPSLDKLSSNKINLKSLDPVQNAISAEVQTLDLGFLA